ncbi:bifunctional 2-keto-4-hydroxyglutarate aldolase/2-keto-3-deoxy-6-phosphogluconate aldolase [Staphylococcus americanisciuri]|uniref:Bifunctional 2-keto-4-hydroxyglutarate aldolase/2-keto-3-deoxy-6-phosphogluconate aldolase n=1 Tax=Staphylococcus americanisciuri TaxID=2973940 RepID=A0ABT2F3F0_9STAP|nr:bifunctional 2-keto-4-hydroxyglutarate aldolase/2-keto-3-deoxy-6-phosphogluconate aldolase [Staphylococcus americanisciuri]MCS4486566.1 bifunctional 2-keto-4-hydroxyglutarate aldolase/2-keto-3-deoxy-6-phosphogluconate aldolase [Staphylococcus americanisciuri]
MKKWQTLQKLHDNYLVAVVRGESKEHAIAAVHQIIDGGIYNIEVTFTTPQAEAVISTLIEQVNDANVVIGAGTVMDAITARIAILNGAAYVVSPHFDQQIAEVCNMYSTPYLPGCGSVTEIVQAMTAGVDVVKLFPGDLLGSNFIKNVHAPIPQVEMMPSGGVSIDNLAEWVAKGAYAVGVGSALLKGATDGTDAIIKSNTQAFVQKLEEIRR